jgi:hypothetical protein
MKKFGSATHCKKFYCYLPVNSEIKDNFLDEPVGTQGRYLWDDLKTNQGAIRRAIKMFPAKSFKIWTYTNFYDKKTFSLVHIQNFIKSQ